MPTDRGRSQCPMFKWGMENSRITMSLKFQIMVVGGPAEDYIERCLESIHIQEYPNWSAQVILDPVGDKTYERALRFQTDQMKIKLNETRNYSVANFLEASRLLNPQDDDVLIMIDADDWLAGPNTLDIVKRYYDGIPELLVTHGSWVPYPLRNVPHNNVPYSEEDFQDLRKVWWRASHLRTCKHKVWKCINLESLKDPLGKYFRVAWDLAIMYPMLEMAGYRRVKWIQEILYVYNQETPFSDDKQNKQLQADTAEHIKNMTLYAFRKAF